MNQTEHLFNSLAAIATGIIGVAILAVLVSRNANTAGVLTASGSAFAGALSAAEAPVTGSGGIANLNLANVGNGETLGNVF